MKPSSPVWLQSSSHMNGAKGASIFSQSLTASPSALALVLPFRWMYQRRSFHVSNSAVCSAVRVLSSSRAAVTSFMRCCKRLCNQRSKAVFSSFLAVAMMLLAKPIKLSNLVLRSVDVFCSPIRIIHAFSAQQQTAACGVCTVLFDCAFHGDEVAFALVHALAFNH